MSDWSPPTTSKLDWKPWYNAMAQLVAAELGLAPGGSVSSVDIRLAEDDYYDGPGNLQAWIIYWTPEDECLHHILDLGTRDPVEAAMMLVVNLLSR